MKCPNCQSEIEPGATFCSECGMQVSATPQPPMGQAPYGMPQQPQQPPQKSNNTVLIVAIAVMATLLVAGAAFWMFSGKDKSDNTSETQPKGTQVTIVQKEEAPADVKSSSLSTLRDKLIDNPYDHDVVEAWIPYLQSQYITSDDIRGINSAQLRLLRNSMFAKHGYSFISADLMEFFTYYSWYTPRYSNVTSMMNRYEIKNVEFIKRHE